MADCRVIVGDLGDSITLDRLILYIESPRCPARGEVNEEDSETKLGCNGTKACIVFGKREDAQRFMRSVHSLDDRKLTVEPWVSGWDRVAIRHTYAKKAKSPSSYETPKSDSRRRDHIYETLDLPGEVPQSLPPHLSRRERGLPLDTAAVSLPGAALPDIKDKKTPKECQVNDTVKIHPENRNMLWSFISKFEKNVEIDKIPEGFELRGLKTDVETAKLKLYEASAKIDKIAIPFLSEKGRLIISEPPCFDEIIEMFKRRQLNAIIYKSNDMVYIVAKDSETVTECYELVSKVVTKREFQVDSAKASHVGGKQWTDVVKSLSTPHRVHIDWTEDDCGTVVSVEGMTEAVEQACIDLQDILEKECKAAVHSEKMELAPAIWRLFKEIAKIDELMRLNYGMEYGKVTWAYQRDKVKRYLTIKGPDSDIATFRNSVKQLVKDVKYNKLDVTKPGLTRQLLEQDLTKKRIRFIEISQQSCIDIEYQGDHLESARTGTMELEEDPSSYSATAAAESSTSVKSCPIKVIKGDLCQFKSDTLVCTVVYSAKVLSKAGAIGKGFVAKGGQSVENGFAALCDSQKHKVLPLGDVYMTSETGNLACKRVIYVPLKTWDRRNVHTQRAALTKYINKCLTKAHEQKMRSIAFPTIGCGGFHFPTAEVAKCFVEVVTKWMSDNSSKMEVSVICFEDKFQKEFEAIFFPRSSFPSPISKDESRPNLRNRRSRVTTGRLSSVVFHIHSVDDNRLKQATEDIKKMSEDCSRVQKYVEECFKELSREEERELLSFSTDGIEFEFNKHSGMLIISGEREAVGVATERVNKFVQEIKCRQQIPELILKKHGIPAYLTALAHKETELPLHWSMRTKGSSALLKHYLGHECKLTPMDASFAQIVEKWLLATWDQGHVGHGADATGLSHSSIKVKQVFLNENPKLYKKYSEKFKDVCIDIGGGKGRIVAINGLAGEPEVLTDIHGVPEFDTLRTKHINEYYLFHGVPRGATTSIGRQGLDFRLGNKGLFGRGVYFAESATKADQYSDRKEKSRVDGTHFMYICRVLLTDPFLCKGARPFKRPPCNGDGCNNETCDKHDFHDSVLGLEKDGGTRLLFREFVIYEKDRCYPEFLVEYERV